MLLWSYSLYCYDVSFLVVATCSLHNDLVKKMTNPSSQGIGKFRSTCQDLWELGRQAWYVPFLWSLAWFSYWIFHDVIVLNQLTQGTPVDFLGVSISISALLFAGYISGKSMTKRLVEKAAGAVEMLKEKFSFRKSFDDNKSTWIPPQKLRQKIMVEKTEHLKREIEREEPLEIGPGQELFSMSDEPVQLSIPSSALSSRTRQLEKAQKIQGISSNCLVCPDLLSCSERQNRKVESVTPCPYAKGLSSKGFS